MSLTPEQFNKLVTKSDHNELKEHVLNIDKKIDNVLSAIDSLAKKSEISESEKITNQSAHDRLQGVIDNHEGRIKNLEKAGVSV